MPFHSTLLSSPISIPDCAGGCGAAVSARLREAGLSQAEAYDIGCSVEVMVRGLLQGMEAERRAFHDSAERRMGQHEEESE
ncbi:hypothetical protein IT575_12045 [bacterium]|nr:hypothetical protein [bacterium]